MNALSVMLGDKATSLAWLPCLNQHSRKKKHFLFPFFFMHFLHEMQKHNARFKVWVVSPVVCLLKHDGKSNQTEMKADILCSS